MENHVVDSEQANPVLSSTRDVLIAARKLIEKPENWIGAEPKDYGCAPYCSATAIWKIGINRAAQNAYRLLCETMGVANAKDFNDAPGRTHTEVLAAFDKAIAEAA